MDPIARDYDPCIGFRLLNDDNNNNSLPNLFLFIKPIYISLADDIIGFINSGGMVSMCLAYIIVLVLICSSIK